MTNRRIRDFAERVIACDAKANRASTLNVAKTFQVCEKLRPTLSTLMGSTGFRALVLRALSLASAEKAWLQPVQVTQDGILDGMDEVESQLDPKAIAEGRVVFIAQLLGLLVAFIGEGLTVQLVREVWPSVSLNGDRK